MIAAYFASQGIGAGAYIASYYTTLFRDSKASVVRSIGIVSTPILLILGLAFLVLDLGNPSHAFYVFSNPLSSVTSLGAILLAISTIITGLQGIGVLARQKRLSDSALLMLLGFIFAVMVAWYPGALLMDKEGIPFWTSPLLPVIFLLTAVYAGAGYLLLVYALLPSRLKQQAERASAYRLLYLALGSAGVGLLLILAHVALSLASPVEACRLSAQYLTTGFFAAPFIALGVVLGTLCPILLSWLSVRKKEVRSAYLALTGLLLICGAIVTRAGVLLVGVYG